MEKLYESETIRRHSVAYAHSLRFASGSAIEIWDVASLPDLAGSGRHALARLEKIGKNARLELANGRPASLHEGDLLAVVSSPAWQKFPGRMMGSST